MLGPYFMESPMPDHLTRTRALIKGCGGSSAVARVFGIRPQAVSAWSRLGIPADRVPSMVTLARGYHLKVTAHDLRPDVWPR